MKTKLFASRHKNEKLNRKVFRYFAVFSILILSFFWLFQVVFLDAFYRSTIQSSFKQAANAITLNIEHENLLDLMISYVRDNEYSLRLISVEDKSTDFIVANNSYDTILKDLSNTELREYYSHASLKKGYYSFERSEVISGFKYNPDSFSGRVPNRGSDIQNYLMVVRIIEAINGRKYMMIGAAPIEPVSMLSSTLSRQLLFASGFMMILSILFAYFLSNRLAKPVVQMTEAAKELGNGNVDVQFNAEGFKELDELNETLNYASNELKKVDTLQKELISNVSHDLRTPLTMIGGYAELLRDFEEERTEENFQVIIDETNRLSDLVDDVLEVSKSKANVTTLNLSTFSLTELLKTTVDHYQKMVGGNFEFVFLYNEEITITADRLKISQVIYNLLNNAVNYAKKDYHIEITQTLNQEKVSVSISNYGDPIAEADLENIFDRYYRAKENHVRAKKGSGLGLSIVKGIVEAHHGKCFVESKEKNTFGFTIPVKN